MERSKDALAVQGLWMGPAGYLAGCPARTYWSEGEDKTPTLRLLLLTGARRGEIEGLKWSEVDFNFGMLGKTTSRTGARVIPRARVAVGILEEQRRWVDRSRLWVLPAHRGEGRFDGLNKEWHRIRNLPALRTFAFTICGAPLPAWVQVVAWGCRSFAEFPGAARPRQRNDTLTC